MTQHYSNPERANDVNDAGAVPDVETFHIGRVCKDPTHTPDDGSGAEEYGGVGWYWQLTRPIFPLDERQFEGEPHGPFATEAEAVADARSDAAGVSPSEEDGYHAPDDDADAAQDDVDAWYTYTLDGGSRSDEHVTCAACTPNRMRTDACLVRNLAAFEHYLGHEFVCENCGRTAS